ncbi:unnamed protein product [Anisakis simplex]|uniref:Uncharacterized protein n=1 Tax=Anisakis simplex TaxID=6269 RepID=A0A0M3K806_ANISI|nr:unnamed protein product [Anisakis simplex]
MATTVPSLITDHGQTPATQKSASNSPHITRKVTDVSRNSSVLTNRTRKSTLKELSPSELLADGTSGWVCPGIDNLMLVVSVFL